MFLRTDPLRPSLAPIFMEGKERSRRGKVLKMDGDEESVGDRRFWGVRKMGDGGVRHGERRFWRPRAVCERGERRERAFCEPSNFFLFIKRGFHFIKRFF